MRCSPLAAVVLGRGLPTPVDVDHELRLPVGVGGGGRRHAVGLPTDLGPEICAMYMKMMAPAA